VEGARVGVLGREADLAGQEGVPWAVLGEAGGDIHPGAAWVGERSAPGGEDSLEVHRVLEAVGEGIGPSLEQREEGG